MAIKRLVFSPQLTTKDIVDAINELYEAAYYTNALLTTNNFGKVEPSTASYGIDGLLAYANGTDWNPGSSGAGFYRYLTASGWIKVG